MIYTVTLDPALDCIIPVPGFKQGKLNHAGKEALYPGGRGIVISIVLSALEYDNLALGFKAGFTGEELEYLLNKQKYRNVLLRADGMTGINMIIRSSNETEIKSLGPEVSHHHLKKLMKRLDAVKDGDFLVLSGDVPDNLPADAYSEILKSIEGKSIHLIIDASGQSLSDTLKFKPFLIKLNKREILDIFDLKTNPAEINDAVLANYGAKLRKDGAENVLIPLGEKGAMLIGEGDNVYKMKLPEGKWKGTIRSEEYLVAGFISGYMKNLNLHDAMKMGVATCSTPVNDKGLPDKKAIEKVYAEMDSAEGDKSK